MRRRVLLAAVTLALAVPGAARAAPPAGPFPFYAMDTSFRRPGWTLQQQLDLVRELGFDGVAWTEQRPDELRAALAELDQRGLKMFAIYCGGRLEADGGVAFSEQLSDILDALRGRGTIIWIHFRGKGPALESLTPDSPVVKDLRELARRAASRKLSVAIYPHYGQWTAHFADAVRLARLVRHPQFGVTFNLCHALAVGDEPRIAELLESGRDVVQTVTICGADSAVAGPNWNRLIQPLGQGSYDVGALLGRLRRLGYRGAVGFQGYGIQDDPRSILTATMKAWRRLWRNME